MIARPRRPWHRRYLPGWIVSGGGGGGGAATVQTDGVTIQGDGSAGNKIAIKAVQTDGSLVGAGTVASVLGQLPAVFYGGPIEDGTQSDTVAQNQTMAWGFQLYAPLTFSKLRCHVQIGDGGGLSSIAIYNPAGTRVAHIAPVAIAAGITAFTFIEGSQTVPPGLYFGAFTSNSAALTIFTVNSWVAPCWSNGAGATVGGASLGSITPLAIAPANFHLPAFQLY